MDCHWVIKQLRLDHYTVIFFATERTDLIQNDIVSNRISIWDLFLFLFLFFFPKNITGEWDLKGAAWYFRSPHTIAQGLISSSQPNLLNVSSSKFYKDKRQDSSSSTQLFKSEEFTESRNNLSFDDEFSQEKKPKDQSKKYFV